MYFILENIAKNCFIVCSFFKKSESAIFADPPIRFHLLCFLRTIEVKVKKLVEVFKNLVDSCKD